MRKNLTPWDILCKVIYATQKLVNYFETWEDSKIYSLKLKFYLLAVFLINIWIWVTQKLNVLLYCINTCGMNKALAYLLDNTWTEVSDA